MVVEKIVLVVSPTPAVAQALAVSVRRCGYTPVIARGFAEAKKQMELTPHLLITELKLAEYNGLQLALRAQSNEAPSIVIADSSFEHEVEQHGAVWVSPTMIHTGELQSVMIRLLQGAVDVDGAAPWYDAESGAQDGRLPAWIPPSSNVQH